jgi:hypothetical protein
MTAAYTDMLPLGSEARVERRAQQIIAKAERRDQHKEAHAARPIVRSISPSPRPLAKLMHTVLAEIAHIDYGPDANAAEWLIHAFEAGTSEHAIAKHIADFIAVQHPGEAPSLFPSRFYVCRFIRDMMHRAGTIDDMDCAMAAGQAARHARGETRGRPRKIKHSAAPLTDAPPEPMTN